MKLTLDQLKVDKYATQVSENELAAIKGGFVGILPNIIVAVATATAKALSSNNDHSNCDESTSTDENGNTVVTHVCHE